MFTRLPSSARLSIRARAIPLALSLLAFAPSFGVAGQAPPCQSGTWQVTVPGYVDVPAVVTVTCSGTITTVDIQWPFDDPSPEAWHNRYVINSADTSVSITVGGEWLCTLQWIPNPDPSQYRYLIQGCPTMYGGTGNPLPPRDPCVQKVKTRVFPDYWIIRNVVVQGGGASMQVLLRAFGRLGMGDAGMGAMGGTPADAPAGSEPSQSTRPHTLTPVGPTYSTPAPRVGAGPHAAPEPRAAPDPYEEIRRLTRPERERIPQSRAPQHAPAPLATPWQ